MADEVRLGERRAVPAVEFVHGTNRLLAMKEVVRLQKA